ncbi:putative fimbrial subunit SteE [Serratia fonticola]|uniref:fimbrial protein n=1 Tax=Serratia fonticola TaxID=47917 RepID=UPI0021827D0C|nr:fimbrial protein [Serratia fonticola]CAI2146479.1 putative fimbrial subunit SteE [Serratia fonticola]
MILKMTLTVLLLLPVVANASEIKNTCWTLSGNNNFNVTLTNGVFSSSKAGAIAKFNYSGVPRYYDVVCWIDYKVNVSGSTPGISWFDITKTNLPASEFGGGFYKLNEDVDVKIVISGVYEHHIPSANGIYGGNDYPVPPGIYTFSSWFAGSTSSSITLRLRRDQLGGILKIPANVELFQDFRAVWEQPVYNEVPIMSMSTAGQFIPVPIVCTINNGAAIEVDFGDLDNTQISSDGSRYVKTVPLQYRCNTAVTQDIDINLIATPAAFSSDFIATTLPDDIGVAVRYNGQIVKPNQKFATTLLNGVGQDELQVAPVIRDVTKVITGSFTASATLIMTMH